MSKNLCLVLILLNLGCSQQSNQSVDSDETDSTNIQTNQLEAVRQRFAEMEATALKEPYKGIFTAEDNDDNLFPIFSTGVSTAPIIDAANQLLNDLSTAQKERVAFAVDDQEWRKWSNVDNGIYVRQGVSLKEMNETQKASAFHLMQTSLSAKGLQLSKDIMKTDQTLKELNNGSSDYDEELYFLTIMGEPSLTEPWGWQLDGHHLIINYFVLGDQVVMSPVFMGGEPIITTTGKYKGNTLFQDEQNIGLAFMQSLSEQQQAKATVAREKTRNNNVGEANSDNLKLEYQGIQGVDLTDEQKSDLLHLINQYVSNMREGHQEIKMEEVTAHIDNTWFSWVGATSKDAVFYYRIHSPVVLIEFDHQHVVGVPNVDRGVPSRNHIHTVVRTPNGNDYGKDLLRQHLDSHEH